jgi:uncharacterized protein YoxC
MTPVDLETTNWLLGVMAVASAIQALVLVFVGVAGYRMYQQVTQTMVELEVRHVIPLRRQVDVVLRDLQGITARVNQQTARVDDVIHDTMERVDETAERVKHNVRDKVAQATGVVRGVRAVIASLLTSDSNPKPPRTAEEQV